MWKILMSSPIVHGNLNIRENRKCDEISPSGLEKNRMIWNYNLIFKPNKRQSWTKGIFRPICSAFSLPVKQFF